jgi:hypothetical protein
VQARTRELTESLEQQTATSEVLGVISNSPGELAPVFQAMLENATRVCGAEAGLLYRLEGQAFRIEAQLGVSREFVSLIEHKAIEPEPVTVLGRILASKQIVNIADTTTDRAYLERNPVFVAAARGSQRAVHERSLARVSRPNPSLTPPAETRTSLRTAWRRPARPAG